MEVLDTVQVALLVTAVIGAVEAVRRAFKRDWEAVIIIGVSALLGALGAMLLVGASALVFFTGLAVGLSASGVVTGVQNFGKKTSSGL